MSDGPQATTATRPDSTGGKLGILLGAGGIRGCAHAGVLRVLDELGISAQIVVGASIGALFGAAHAAGWSAGQIAAIADRAPTRAVAEFYLNRLRIDKTTYIGSILSELGQETSIEDLPKPFACMALDCERGEVVALNTGPLLRSLEASIALPGIARPVSIGESTYLDGGLKGPVPASVARNMGADTVIRVDLCKRHPLRTSLGRRYRSFGAYVLSRVGPAGSSRPLRGITMLGTATPNYRNTDEADVSIDPEFFGLFCNSPIGVGFCVRRGELAARRELPQLSRYIQALADRSPRSTT